MIKRAGKTQRTREGFTTQIPTRYFSEKNQLDCLETRNSSLVEFDACYPK
jgi:hypothetical protein